jgi:hypothetical protein
VHTCVIISLPTEMDLLRMISELQSERQRLDEAIQALERLSAGKSRRRGRPPGWLKEEVDRHLKTADGVMKSESDAGTEPEV